MDTRIIIIISAAVFVIVVLFFLFGFILKYQKRNIDFEIEKQQLQSHYQQEILQTQLEIQEQTLKTISQEIHDNIGQTLSLAKLNLALEDEQQNGNNIKVASSHQLVSKAIQDLRDLSRSLNTDYVAEMGLIRSIEYELEMISKTGVIKTNLQVEGQQRKLDKQKELILFRIVQESLNNIIKHAGADRLMVAANYQPGELLITINDNGKGVDLTPLNENGNAGFGLGIRNMNNRAKLIGADFSMASTIGSGTTVSIKLTVE
jgi:two-component system NarL family sensor kinase